MEEVFRDHPPTVYSVEEPEAQGGREVLKVTVVTKAGVNLGPTPCSSTHTNWPKEGAEMGTQCTPTPLPAGRRTLRPFPPSQDQTGPYPQHNMPTWKARKVRGLVQSQTVLGGVCTEGHQT